MKSNRTHAVTAAVLTALALTFAATPCVAQAPGVAVIPPSDAQTQTGMTYGEWSAVWWQYALSKSTPDPNNPFLGPTAQGCAVDQPRSSPVFFLVGIFGSGSVIRSGCTVPAGKALFIPLLNFVDIHFPGDGLDTPQLLWNDAESFLGTSWPSTAVTEVHASIDGVPVSPASYFNPATTPLRACAGGTTPPCSAPAPAFSITLPGNNLFSACLNSPQSCPRTPNPRSVKSVPAGVYSPVVADGLFLMLAPLPPGSHTIRFGGTFAGTPKQGPFKQDITYLLNVQ